MVDDMTPQYPMGMPGEPEVAQDPSGPEGKKGFFATTKGRIVLIVGASVLLLGIAGAVAAYFLVFITQEALEEVIVQMNTPAASQSSEDSDEMTPVEPDPLGPNAVFTFRDIFDPLIKPESAETSGSVGSTSTPDVSQGTLYLSDVYVEDGEPVAILLWNGEEYQLREGESISGTPWQVQTIYSDSVVMLYGDVEITLSLGQGITK